jgi:hypothetical protein
LSGSAKNRLFEAKQIKYAKDEDVGLAFIDAAETTPNGVGHLVRMTDRWPFFWRVVYLLQNPRKQAMTKR